MIRADERSAISALVLATLVVFLYATSSLSPTARVVPLVVLVPTIALAVVQLLLDLVPTIGARLRGAEPAAAPEHPARRRSELIVVAWIGALLGLVLLFGLLVALPLYTLLYLKLQAGERHGLSLGVALCVLVILYGVFVLGLRIRLFEGLVPPLVGF